MPNIIQRLNNAVKVLFGSNSNTRVGIDNEFVDSSLLDINTVDNNRLSKYEDYVSMDDVYGQEISSSLDAVADMVLRVDQPIDKLINITSDSKTVIKIIDSLFYRLKIDSKLWTWARSLSKFGDLFVEVVWSIDSNKNKIVDLIELRPLPTKTIFKNIDSRGNLDKVFPYRQEVDGQVVAKFKLWQIIHFKLDREPTDDFGTSWLKPARLPFRQLSAMENSLVIDRIKRSKIRVHKVDVTGKTGDQATEAVNRYKEQFKKKVWYNPNTGTLEKHTTPVVSDSDIYMGVTKDGGKSAGIDLLEGKSEIDIKDVLYFRDKLMAALKVPKYRLNITDIGTTTKSPAADQGLYFSASIQKVQRALMEGLSYLVLLKLLINNIDITDRSNDFSLTLPKQRSTDELIAARVELIKSTIAKNYKELGIVSDEYIMDKLMGINLAQQAKIKKQLDKNRQNIPNQNIKNFNKTGFPSAPVRNPQKEDLDSLLNDEKISVILNDVSELIKNDRVYNSKFLDKDFLKKEMSKIIK